LHGKPVAPAARREVTAAERGGDGQIQGSSHTWDPHSAIEEASLSEDSLFCLSYYPGLHGSFDHREKKFDQVALHVIIHGRMGA
jgi:hypothetical protein